MDPFPFESELIPQNENEMRNRQRLLSEKQKEERGRGGEMLLGGIVDRIHSRPINNLQDLYDRFMSNYKYYTTAAQFKEPDEFNESRLKKWWRGFWHKNSLRVYATCVFSAVLIVLLCTFDIRKLVHTPQFHRPICKGMASGLGLNEIPGTHPDESICPSVADPLFLPPESAASIALHTNDRIEKIVAWGASFSRPSSPNALFFQKVGPLDVSDEDIAAGYFAAPLWDKQRSLFDRGNHNVSLDLLRDAMLLNCIAPPSSSGTKTPCKCVTAFHFGIPRNVVMVAGDNDGSTSATAATFMINPTISGESDRSHPFVIKDASGKRTIQVPEKVTLEYKEIGSLKKQRHTFSSGAGKLAYYYAKMSASASAPVRKE